MALQPGDRFGRYELVSWLGRGGMAETWRARLVGDAGVTKPVLIKKVLPEFSGDEAFISMFISEARISATLSHGNVAQVFDFGRVDGDYFLAMEYVDGQPLHRILKRAARTGLPVLPIPLATFIALEMCKGLHYAHARTDDKGQPLGIVHRDISPDNVLVSYEGQVKIVDFGIAKARSLRTFDTEPGVVKGKYLFFSPEQARGKQVDARTDVWATGLVLYELLCGQRPVTGPPHTVMMRMASGDFPSPRELRKDLPAELNDIVMRALSVELAGRFESSHAFGDALAGFLYGFAPRFSSMNLAHLVRELFREELAQEGRELAVPPSFQAELAQWRDGAPVASTAREGASATPTPVPARRTAVSRAPTPETVPAPARSPRLSRGALIAGAGATLTLGAVAVLLTWGSAPPAENHPSSPRPLRAADSEARAVEAPRETATALVPAAPTVATAAREALDAGTAVQPPTVAPLTLDARRDVIVVPRRLVAFSKLTPGMSYGFTEISESPLPEPKTILEPSPSNPPPVFFLLSGAKMAGNVTLGELPREPLPFRDASAISIFTLGPAPRVIFGQRVIQLVSSRVGSEKLFVFEAQSDSVSVENAALLKGLSPATTYVLTLKPVGEGAFLHRKSLRPVRQVACVQATPPAQTEGPDAGWPVAFVLAQDEEVRVRGMEALKCGFVDDDPSDNQGFMQILVRPFQSVQDPPQHVVPGSQLAEAERLSALAREQEKAAGYSKSGLQQALLTAETCLQLVPDHADCLLMSGSSLARLGRMDEGACRATAKLTPSRH